VLAVGTHFYVAIVRIVDLFSYDLYLHPMTFISLCELDPYFLEINRMCKYELPTTTSSLSKVIVFIANRTCNTTITMVTVFATREYGMYYFL